MLTVLSGLIVHHQVPLHSITPSPLSSTPTLFHFESYASYLIPRQSFCSFPLSFCTPTHRILYHPICISSSKYPRNEFLFTFALVLSIATPAHPYIPIIRKLVTLFSTLEEQSHFLSRDISPLNTGPVFAICEILREDLNIYSECMVPVDDSNSLNIKLFPTYPPPPSISPHHVPLSTVQLDSLTDHNWDLTMLLILPYIDGVNSVKRISHLADADYKLVRIAIAHLLYYGCITLLDVFHFGASYAATAELGAFISDEAAQEDCKRYVLIPDTGLPRTHIDQSSLPDMKVEALNGTRLVELYASFKQGYSIRDWCLDHESALKILDIRRFVTFGVIKGFLYRVSKYAFSTSDFSKQRKRARVLRDEQSKAPLQQARLPNDLVESNSEPGEVGQRIGYRNHDLTCEQEKRSRTTPNQQACTANSHNLLHYLNGLHSLDEICTELEIGEKDLIRVMKDIKDIQIIQR